MLLFFHGGFIGGTLICSVANSYDTLLAARIITGLFGGVTSSITSAVFTDSFEIDQRGRAISFLQMGQAARQVLGPFKFMTNITPINKLDNISNSY